MNLKKITTEEREKKEIERLIKKAKLVVSVDKPKLAKFYAGKISKLLAYYNGNKNSLETLYYYGEIIKFAHSINEVLDKIIEPKSKTKKKTGDLSKLLIYLFVLLYCKEPKEALFKYYLDLVSENIKMPTSLAKSFLKQLVCLIVLLQEFKGEINHKYAKLDPSTKELSGRIEKGIFPMVHFVIKNTKFEKWENYFTTKIKNGIIKKDFVRLKFILSVLYIEAIEGERFYIEQGRINQDTSDYFKLLSIILGNIKELPEEEKVKFLYLSIQDIANNERALEKNIAELIGFASCESERLVEEANSFLMAKGLEYKKQIFAPFISRELTNKKVEDFFCNIKIASRVLGQDALAGLFDLLEEKHIYNEYYDYLSMALNRKIKHLSSKIEIILREPRSDNEKIEELNAIKESKNIIELFSEFQNSDYTYYKKHFENHLFVEWLGTQLLKDISQPLTFSKSIFFDQEILKVIESVIAHLNFRIEKLAKSQSDKDTSLSEIRKENENLSKALERLKFDVQEQIKEREGNREEIEQLKEQAELKEREEKENLEVLKGTFQVSEDRNKDAVKNEFIMRIIKIVDKINILMAQGGEVNCSFVKSLLEQELSAEGVETFGEIGQQVKFNEALYAPVELSRSEDYLEKPVVILEKGYRYKDGKLIKKAIVRPLCRSDA